MALLHGLTAQRRYVVHGSRVLPRQGLRAISYDARGHGESDPAPAGGGYSYPELAADLGGVLEAQAPEGRCLLAGHSMGAHTLTAYALANPERVAAIIVIGPTYTGGEPSAESLAYWDRLSAGLAEGGIDGFIEAYDVDLDPQWRETLLRLARQRLELHRNLAAVADAIHDLPRSRPFGDLAALAALDLPALVVASGDDADSGHPYAIAERWAELLPQGQLISEAEGESPLAWQGGRLSRAIAQFCARPEVTARLAG